MRGSRRAIKDSMPRWYDRSRHPVILRSNTSVIERNDSVECRNNRRRVKLAQIMWHETPYSPHARSTVMS